MLAELKFVLASTAKKDYIPALTSFVFEKGTVRGYNGTLALCSPVPFDIECKPKAQPMYQAIRNCTETISLSMTAAGRLSIKSGKFKAFIECIEGESNHVEPEGKAFEINGETLYSAIKRIEPFIADDASRPWSNGVLLKGSSAFATNNVTLVEFWTGVPVAQPLNIPRPAVKEILRIGEAPTHAQATETSVTLHYAGGRWIRTQLLSTDWPDLSRVLDRESKQKPIDQSIFQALDTIANFTDKTGRVIFKDGSIRTSLTEGDGAVYELDNHTDEGSYNAVMLQLLNGVADSIDWSSYPSPCIFQGDRLRGAIIGMRPL